GGRATPGDGRPPLHAVAGGRAGQPQAVAGGVRAARRAGRLPGYAAIPRGVVRLRQPDRRLPGQGELQIREHGDGLQPRRESHRAGLSLPHHRAQPGPILPVPAAGGPEEGRGGEPAGRRPLPPVRARGGPPPVAPGPGRPPGPRRARGQLRPRAAVTTKEGAPRAAPPTLLSDPFTCHSLQGLPCRRGLRPPTWLTESGAGAPSYSAWLRTVVTHGALPEVVHVDHA